MERKILPGLEKKALGMSLLALAAVPVILASSCTVRRVAGLSPVAAMNRQAVVEASRADLGLLTWPEQLDAVRYELELLDGIPLNLDPAREADPCLISKQPDLFRPGPAASEGTPEETDDRHPVLPGTGF